MESGQPTNQCAHASSDDQQRHMHSEPLEVFSPPTHNQTQDGSIDLNRSNRSAPSHDQSDLYGNKIPDQRRSYHKEPACRDHADRQRNIRD
jgi:hypothetical protein